MSEELKASYFSGQDDWRAFTDEEMGDFDPESDGPSPEFIKQVIISVQSRGRLE